MALYHPHDLSDVHQLEYCICELNAHYCHNEPGSMLPLVCIISGEYVVCYITSLFQKIILLRNVLLGVNLVANTMLIKRYIDVCMYDCVKVISNLIYY